MDYKELVDKLRNNNIEDNCHDCALGYYAFEAAAAITNLLIENQALRNAANGFKAIAKTAEDRRKELEERAEKAERELRVAVGGLVGQCKYCRKNQECTSRKGSHLYCWEWFGAKEE